MIKELNGDRCHEMLAREIKGKLAYSDNCNYDEWKLKIRTKLNELLKLDVTLPCLSLRLMHKSTSIEV